MKREKSNLTNILITIIIILILIIGFLIYMEGRIKDNLESCNYERNQLNMDKQVLNSEINSLENACNIEVDELNLIP